MVGAAAMTGVGQCASKKKILTFVSGIAFIVSGRMKSVLRTFRTRMVIHDSVHSLSQSHSPHERESRQEKREKKQSQEFSLTE